jgi:hypothetical protein
MSACERRGGTDGLRLAGLRCTGAGPDDAVRVQNRLVLNRQEAVANAAQDEAFDKVGWDRPPSVALTATSVQRMQT